MNLELPLDGKSRAKLRALSDVVFGSAASLEILLAFALNDEVYIGELAHLAGAHESYTSTFVRRLETVGVVEQAPRAAGMRRKYYRRRESPMWHLVVAWTEDLLHPTDEVRITRLVSPTEDSSGPGRA